MNKSEAHQISNKIVEVSRINIFDNTRDRDYVYYRSLLAYVLKNKLNMGWTNIAKFFKANLSCSFSISITNNISSIYQCT